MKDKDKDKDKDKMNNLGFSKSQRTNLYLSSPYLFAELLAFAETSHPDKPGITEKNIQHFQEVLEASVEPANTFSPKLR
jgi:hypothetical protein